MPATPQTFSKLKEINDNQWSIILKQLIIYSELRLSKIGFEPKSEMDSVTGEDFAMEAIVKLFEGSRKWDFDKYPDVVIHLKLIVKSLIWNHLKSSKKAIVKTEDINSFQSSEESDEEVNYWMDEENPEEIVISRERWQQIELAFGEDADGFIVFCEWLDEIPPRKISEKYNIDVKIVNNTIKKGKRIISKIYARPLS